MIQSLYTGLSSLLSNQKALDVTSHNIANVNTEGYSKQNVEFKTLFPKKELNKEIGNGVTIASIERSFDPYLFKNIKNSTMENSSNQKEFETIEGISKDISVEKETLTSLLDKFFNNVEKIAENPEDLSLKASAKIYGNSLIERKGVINNIFDTYIDNLNKEKNSLFDKSVELQDQLTKISKEITIQEAGKYNSANDLRDKRDMIEKELSSIGNFNSYNDNENYIFEFDENNGTLNGINNSIKNLNTLKSKFNETFSPLENKMNNFFKDNMKDPNTLINWYYDNNENFNDYFSSINTQKESFENKTAMSEMILGNYNKQNEKNKVNLDEEMVNLIKYQRAYEAAAKVIQTSDEILKTTLSLKS